MRLGFLIYGGLDTLSGGYLYDRTVIEGLRRNGHEVEVIGLPSSSYLNRLRSNFFSRPLCHLLEAKLDVLIEDELCHPSLFLLNKRLLRGGGPPLVALVHHILSGEPRPNWQNLLLGQVEKRFLNSVDGFIFNSATTRQTVTALLDHDRPYVIAYPAGDRFGTPLPAAAIRERAHRSGPLHLLFLGNVIPRKGLQPLLHALAGIDPVLWQLSVVGSLDFEPAHAKEVQQMVRQYNLGKSVRFLGPLQDQQLVEVLKTSHLFCMPYAYEGFGIAILESMAFGLPAIGCQQGGAGETICSGMNGFLLAPGDLTSLRSLITGLYNDRGWLERLALSAIASYAGRPTWQDSITVIDAFLEKLAMRKKTEVDHAGE